MSEKNNLIALYKGLFSNSIFKFIEQDKNLILATENHNGKKNLVFNNVKEDGVGEYSFAEIIDFACEENYLDKKKIAKLKELASELNNILLEKNDYDTQKKIFDNVNKIRLVYLELMNLLKEISNDLKRIEETIEKRKADLANFLAVYNRRSYKVYDWLYNKIIFRWLSWIIGLFSNFNKIRQKKSEINKKKSELKKLEGTEKIETLIDYQSGILMSNKIFFADLGSRLCDALKNGDKFNNKSIDEILKNPSENTKVFYIDQDTENLKSFGNGLVNTIYEFDDNSKVLKFGKIFIDPLSIKLNNEFAYKDAALYQEKSMGNIKNDDIEKEDEELLIEIKKLAADVANKLKDETVNNFFDKLVKDKKFLHRIAALINKINRPMGINDIKKILYDFAKNEISKQTSKNHDTEIKQTIENEYGEILNFVENKNIREVVMKEIKFVLIELDKKYGVLINAAFRANIAYELASMLNFNCIVKTEVGVSKKDYVSIMEKLKSRSFSSYFNGKEEEEKAFVKATDKYFESAIELMIIDYLLAQSDRHNNNFFVDFNSIINAVTKIIGIDNDFILAIAGEQKNKIDKYNTIETKAPVLVKRIRDSVLSLREEDFVGLLDFFLDNEQENKKLAIESAKKRLANLKVYAQNAEIIDINKSKSEIINKFVEPVKKFEEDKKNEIKKEKGKPTRLYGNPIFQNMKYGNNIEIIKGKENHIPAGEHEKNESDKSTDFEK